MRTVRTLLTLPFLMILVITSPRCVRAQTPAGPTLLTEENSQRAIALDSVTRVRSPLPVVAQHNFSADRRTRVALFGINLDLMPAENASAVTAQARDSRSRNYSLKVELVRKVPTLDWLTQVVVRLPDELAQAGDVSISVSLRGQTSNEVLFNVAVQSEPRTVTLPARRITNGKDNYVDAAFSFEHGMNGEGAVPVTRNDWDILFGNSPDRDTFGVTMVVDDCSRIQDMGALNWSDAIQVPAIPAHPVPKSEPQVKAVIGHMYVVHTKDTETDLYFLFRVEALEIGNSVTISWKGVQRPLGD
jgi:hypothetical protein